jgi:hypothetical protein
VAVAGTLGGRSLPLTEADSIHGTLIEYKHDEHSQKAEEKQGVTLAQPRLNQPSSNTNNRVGQTSQQDTPPASDDEDKIKQRPGAAGREPQHAKVEGIRESILVKDDLEATYKYLETYILGEEDDDEIPQRPQCPAADQKDEDVLASAAHSRQVSSEPPNHLQPPTPPPEITQTVALDRSILQPEGTEVPVHTPVVPGAQVRPLDQTAPVTQGNNQTEGFSSLVTPDMTPPAPVYSEPPVQQSAIPALPE